MPYAAAVLVVVTASVWIFQGQVMDYLFKGMHGRSGVVNVKDFAPGTNRATLTLADGRTIELSAEHAGVVMGDGITYLDGSDVLSGSSAQTHTLSLTTPKGGTYQITLPDGTAVWLNAASRLTYHEDNLARQRVVELDGEAFFQVKSAKDRPFKVRTKGQEVDVLGTSFNVNSYPDEPTIRTTLVDGALKVTGMATQQAVLLAPGQQATLDRGHRVHVDEVRVEDAVAWKSGMFSFNNTDIEAIVRQLSRWYDVEVVFQGNSPHINLWGEVYRDVNASEALDILHYFGLRYRVEQHGNSQRIVIYNE